MNFPVEFKGERVLVVWNSHEVFNTLGDQLFRVPRGSIIHLCAWCRRGGWAEKALKQEGYTISHGICRECSQKQVVNQQQTARAEEG